LENVGLAVGDQNHVELVQRLVYEADVVLLHGSMLGAAVGQFRERCQQCLYPGPWHLAELPREDGLAAPGADGGSEDNLKAMVSWCYGWLWNKAIALTILATVKEPGSWWLWSRNGWATWSKSHSGLQFR